MRSVFISYTNHKPAAGHPELPNAEEEARAMLRQCTFIVRKTEVRIFVVPDAPQRKSDRIAEDTVWKLTPKDGDDQMRRRS